MQTLDVKVITFFPKVTFDGFYKVIKTYKYLPECSQHDVSLTFLQFLPKVMALDLLERLSIFSHTKTKCLLEQYYIHELKRLAQSEVVICILISRATQNPAFQVGIQFPLKILLENNLWGWGWGWG